MISPTGLGIRIDAGGDGNWGSNRTRVKNGISVKYKHKGTDFKSKFAQEVVAPFDMTITRVSKPNDSYLSGIAFETASSSGRMWYFSPFKRIIGQTVKQGDVIGTAQSLQPHYSKKVTDHVHFQFNEIDPMIMMEVASILKSMRVIKDAE